MAGKMYSTCIKILYVNRYLVDQRWFKQWKIYVGYDYWDQWNTGIKIRNPGPVDNGRLFKGNKLIF